MGDREERVREVGGRDGEEEPGWQVQNQGGWGQSQGGAGWGRNWDREGKNQTGRLGVGRGRTERVGTGRMGVERAGQGGWE